MDTFVLTNTLNGKFITNKTLSVLDSFNSKNMAYFNNLFANMSKIYQHLQIFIFVLIGGFFVTQIGASKLQAYLENRGESEGKQPYLHKFYIPLLMIGVFFMPIPEGNGYNSTVMQNMIRYFAQYSTTIADMANSVGVKTYIDKIYATAGHLSPEKLDKLKKERENSKKETEFYKQVVEIDNKDIGEKCFNSRAQQNTTYIGSHGGSIKYDNNGQVFYSCLDYGKDIMRFNEASARLNKLDNELKFISLYSSQYGDTLNKIDEYFTARNKELGWIDAMLTPTAGILVEIFTLSQVTEAMKDYQKENIKERQIAIKQYFNNGNLEQSQESVKNQVGFKTKINDGVMGYIGGRMVYIMMPGAKELQSFLYQSFDMIYNVIKSIITGTVAYFGGFASAALTGIGLSWIGSLVNFIFCGVTEMSKIAFSYYAATILMEWTITMIPLLAISTACLVACIAYLVSLCKYFYISPFVTAWAMATKKTDKIIDFLLVGIAIFFKPTLIILFVYLSLFMQTLVQDFFVFVSMEQFAAIESDWDNFHTNFITGAIGGLIQIFGMLAASYVAWRLIVSGPGWALSLIGLDGKHDDMVAGGLENNLAKRAFVA